MQPTNKLRFVKRMVRVPVKAEIPDPTMSFSILMEKEILQQWFEGELVPGRNDDGGEWRDIEVEKE